MKIYLSLLLVLSSFAMAEASPKLEERAGCSQKGQYCNGGTFLCCPGQGSCSGNVVSISPESSTNLSLFCRPLVNGDTVQINSDSKLHLYSGPKIKYSGHDNYAYLLNGHEWNLWRIPKKTVLQSTLSNKYDTIIV